jgi:hypothetical protein
VCDLQTYLNGIFAGLSAGMLEIKKAMELEIEKMEDTKLDSK